MRKILKAPAPRVWRSSPSPFPSACPTSSIDARYNLGVTNVAKHNGDKKPKYSVIMLTLGYKIPF